MSEGRILLAVATGGAVGALGRWGVGLLASGAAWGTLLVNVSGAFALGLLVVWLSQREPHPLLRPFLSVGLLGGWTTYSTFALDAHALGGDSLPGLLVYLLTTVVLGVGAALCGVLLGDRLWGGDSVTDAATAEGEL